MYYNCTRIPGLERHAGQDQPEINIPDDHWVVLIWDPDYADTSLWSVRSSTYDEAVAIAGALWRAWLMEADDPEGDDNPGEPEVHRVFGNSWIDERWT